MLETQSQAYEFNWPPAEALVDALAEEIAALGADARFFGNADHVTPQAPQGSGEFIVARSVSWRPLSKATFDTGILGVGRTLAFIVWAEEED
ncbi:MAG: hypothetical protein JNL41_10360 [Phenylobacterium sp.]|uniref:hypothetical protein n=1 Tax=Phenylobacterium sp. TaxID=1871053 RepID=UPI001A3C5B11|nr:hypothetical protein [Phenylobacterium sp.]MBL8554669.1 hypothetical protein [Phenylobacterium sp.]